VLLLFLPSLVMTGADEAEAEEVAATEEETEGKMPSTRKGETPSPRQEAVSPLANSRPL
jgi:hypothetical protein